MDFAINGRLPQIVQRFRAKYPQVSIYLAYMPTALQRIALLEGRIDVGFVIGDIKGQHINNDPVDEEEFVALLPAGHRLASRSKLSLSDLAEEPFVIGSEDTFSSFRGLVFELCRNAGFFPNIVQEASNSNGIFGLVAAAAGVTLYAACARNIQRAGVVIKRLADIEQRIPIVAVSLVEALSEVLKHFRGDLLLDSRTSRGALG